jgi:hypothetical protein
MGYEVDLKLLAEHAPELLEVQEERDLEAMPQQPASPRKRRGRPCKCIERGLICKHHTAREANSLIHQSSSPGEFS